MSSKTDKPVMRSAAWRISLWAALAFTCGTMLVFIFIDRFVANDIQRRSDAWLSGEVEVLGDVAERTPNDALYNRVVGEVAELASREVPNKAPAQDDENDSVFFLQTGRDGTVKLWVGSGDGQSHLDAIRAHALEPDMPSSIRVRGFSIPFRVAATPMKDGGLVYLGLSERDELRVLRNLRIRFFILWLSLVLLGFAIVFFTSRRTLSHVRGITEAASRIGQTDLTTRVPTTRRNDEISQLAFTLNRMLDRIENTVRQLHTITDSLAHDLRSPLTAIRGKLESSVASATDDTQLEAIVSAIEELDRLTEFLNKSLDVAEARADALRLTPTEINLEDLLRSMIALYEPSMSEKGLQIRFQSSEPLRISGDEGLIHRMIANLFDNELKHLPNACTVTVTLRRRESDAQLVLQDDGAGFDPEVRSHLFAERVKGRNSTGHGLGLAFVDAVVRAHSGTVSATNGDGGGAQIIITLPLIASETSSRPAVLAG
jgi:signal transduction histidine kinase